MSAGTGGSDDIAAALRQVTTPTLTTQLWYRGLRNTSIPNVRPVDPGNCRFVGQAYTIRYLALREDLLPLQQLGHPDSLMAKAVEEAPAGGVVVLDSNGRNDVGLLGGNLAMRLKARGIAGAVTDGGMRDLGEITDTGLPVFMTAMAAPPSMTQLMIADLQCPVSCGGVPVLPGDYVVSDEEGVVVVPANIAAEVAKDGLELDRVEAYVYRRLKRGDPVPGLYPPSDATMEAYRRWVAAGEPDELDV